MLIASCLTELLEQYWVWGPMGMAAQKFRMLDQSLILWETVDKHSPEARVRSKRVYSR